MFYLCNINDNTNGMKKSSMSNKGLQGVVTLNIKMLFILLKVTVY